MACHCCIISSYNCTREVVAQYIWENKARVIVDFSPGPGTFEKMALLMSCKIICVVHNEQHEQWLKRTLTEFVKDEMIKNNPLLSPSDKKEQCEKLKPHMLKLYEKQQALPNKKRPNEGEDVEAKRATKAVKLDDVIDQFVSGESAAAKAAASKSAAAKAAAAKAADAKPAPVEPSAPAASKAAGADPVPPKAAAPTASGAAATAAAGEGAESQAALASLLKSWA